MPNKSKFNSNTQARPVVAIDNRFIEYVKNGLMTREGIAKVVRPIDEQLAEQIEHGLITQAATIEAVSQLAKDGESNQGNQNAQETSQQSIDGRDLDKQFIEGLNKNASKAQLQAVFKKRALTPSVKTEPIFSLSNYGAVSCLVKALASHDSESIVLHRDEVQNVMNTVSTLLSASVELPQGFETEKELITLLCSDLTGLCEDYINSASEAEYHLKLAQAEQDKPF